MKNVTVLGLMELDLKIYALRLTSSKSDDIDCTNHRYVEDKLDYCAEKKMLDVLFENVPNLSLREKTMKIHALDIGMILDIDFHDISELKFIISTKESYGGEMIVSEIEHITMSDLSTSLLEKYQDEMRNIPYFYVMVFEVCYIDPSEDELITLVVGLNKEDREVLNSQKKSSIKDLRHDV